MEKCITVKQELQKSLLEAVKDLPANWKDRMTKALGSIVEDVFPRTNELDAVVVQEVVAELRKALAILIQNVVPEGYTHARRDLARDFGQKIDEAIGSLRQENVFFPRPGKPSAPKGVGSRVSSFVRETLAGVL